MDLMSLMRLSFDNFGEVLARFGEVLARLKNL